MELKQAVEAILFASDDPITSAKITEALKEALPEVRKGEVEEVIRQLKADYDNSGRGFSIEEIAGGVQVLTRPQFADIIAKLRRSKAEKKLSAAALETLAIVAYKQPIKRADLEAIRGVASSEVLRALMERRLLKIVGREEIPGAPVQYGTTAEFLEAFGIKSLEDLPRPEEVK
jgi:segregation and condensation protein B